MFSAILGLATGIGSLIQGGQAQAAANAELGYKYAALEQQKNQAALQFGLGQDQLRLEREQMDYVKSFNERNLREQEVQRARIEQQMQQRLGQYQEERQYMIDRQIEIDRAAAEQRAFQLEQFLSNQNLAKEERNIALAALNEAKMVAKGEREDDLRRLAEEKVKAQQERQWAIEQFEIARGTASSERQEDLAYRDRIMSSVNEMATRMQRAYDQMGEIIAPGAPSEREIDETIAMYEDNATRNVDRAADRVASQMEAALIGGGMNRSTTATQRRSEIARKLALDYENARLSARNQAMEYIKGKDALASAGFERELMARGRTVDEIASVYTPQIDALTQNRQTLSANAFSAPVTIGSGIVQRGVASANDYSAPLQVGSAIYEPNGVGNGLGETINPQSIADAYRITQDYNAFQPQMWNITSPAGFFGSSANLYGSMAGQYDPGGMQSRADALTSSGWGAIGSGLNDLSKSSWFSSSPSANASSGFRIPTNVPIPTTRPGTVHPIYGR